MRPLAGSILSDASIVHAVENSWIRISPFNRKHVQPASYDLTIEIDKPLRLFRGEFHLLLTRERVSLDPAIQGDVHGRSSVGRVGVLVHFTAGYIDPGWDGQITLEVMSFVGPTRWRYYFDRLLSFLCGRWIGGVPFVIEPGDRLCQMRFLWLDQPAHDPYHGRYQHQDQPLESLFLHGDR